MASIFILAALIFFFGRTEGEIDWPRLVVMLLAIIVIRFFLLQHLHPITETIAIILMIAAGLSLLLKIPPQRAFLISVVYAVIASFISSG
jgi:hypothetical protein